MSLHMPETDAAPLSGPLYVVLVQLSMPEVWSEPSNAIATGRLYQPFRSASRPAWPAVTAGAVAS